MRIAPFVLALVAALAVPRAARACSCMSPPSPAQAVELAAAVFEGRTFGVVREGDQNRFTFEVTRVWKGDLAGRVEVWSRLHSASCGRGFETGTSYVIYATSQDGRLTDYLCSRTREVSRASEDLEVLGPGRAPFEPAAPPPAAGPEVEPPRIEPQEPPPTSASARGCMVGSHEELVGLLALALVRRRRARRLADKER